MSFVVFLDVDGVLNSRTSCVSSPSGVHVGVEPMRVKLLSDAMKWSGAEGAVLTSTWKDLREDDEDYRYLIESLSEHGISVIGKIEEERVDRRETGIIKYLKEHPEMDEFVILDDQHFGFKDHEQLWESFLDTKGIGIEHATAASETPSVPVMIFLDAIEKFS